MGLDTKAEDRRDVPPVVSAIDAVTSPFFANAKVNPFSVEGFSNHLRAKVDAQVADKRERGTIEFDRIMSPGRAHATPWDYVKGAIATAFDRIPMTSQFGTAIAFGAVLSAALPSFMASPLTGLQLVKELLPLYAGVAAIGLLLDFTRGPNR